MTMHRGQYDWGGTRQSADERTRRAEIDLQKAAEALQRTEPGTTAHGIVQARYDRAVARLEEGE